MDITIPPDLQWVSYLAAGTWTQGSETGMRRIRDILYDGARQLEATIPDLNSVRAETLSVLSGETARAADEQFAMLFDGDYSVGKLADAVRALGDSADYMADEVQSSKIRQINGLAFAAAEISWHLARAPATWGASLSWIPPTEAWTVMTLRQVVAGAMGRIGARIRDTLSRTSVRQLLPAAFRSARHEVPEEIGWALSEQATADLILAAMGLDPHLSLQNYGLTTFAAGLGGGVGGGSSVPVNQVVGAGGHSKLGAAGRGMLTMGISGGLGSAAGALAVLPFTGEFSPESILVGGLMTSIGGVKGIGPPQTGPGFTHPPGTASLPPGPLPTSDGDRYGSFAPRGGDGANFPSGEPVPDTIGRDNGGWIPRGGDGADMPSAAPSPNTTPTVNDVSAQQDLSASSPATSIDPAPTDDEASQSALPVPPSDADDLPTQSHEGATLTVVPTGDDGPGQDPTPGMPVAETPDLANDTDPTPSDHAPADTELPLAPDTDLESRVESATDRSTTTSTPNTPPLANTLGPAAASPTPSPSAVHTPVIPQAQAPSSSPQSAPASTPPQVNTAVPRTAEPKQTAPKDVSASQTAASPSAVAGAPAAGLSDTTAARAEPGPETRATVGDDQPSRPPADPTRPPTEWPVNTDTPNCGVGAVQFLSGWHERKFGLGVDPTSEGVPARAVFEAVNSRADFTTFADAADALLDPDVESGSSAVLTWSWAADGGRRGGHTAVLIKDGDDVFLYDPHTNQHYQYNQQTQQFTDYWGQDAISQMAVGYLQPNGDAVKPLDGSPAELVEADEIGHVQGHPVTAHVSAEQLASLTPRQREVLALLADGLTDREIANRLVISVRTAESHVGSVLKKVGIHDRTQLADGGLADRGPLTPREREVTALIVEGYTDREIAAELHIGLRTAHEHVRSILSKLGARNRVQLVAIAHQSPLLEPSARTGVAAPLKVGLSQLTRREHEVISLVAQGLTDAEIAAELAITVKTTGSHISNILSKLGARNRVQLVAMAYRSGLLDPEPGARPNCGKACVRYLSDRHGRAYALDAEATAEGLAARAVYTALNVRPEAEFTTFADSADNMLGPDVEPGSSAQLAWTWADDGGRRGGHSAVLIKKDDNNVYLYDPHTDQEYQYNPGTRQFDGYVSQDAVSKMVVGYLKPNGEAVTPLDGTPGELSIADEIGFVKGMQRDPGERWRDVPAGIDPDGRLAKKALRKWEQRLTPKKVDKLCRRPGSADEVVKRAPADTRVWRTLTGEEQRALIDHYSEFIGNGIGFPEAARYEANSVKLQYKRNTRDRLLREQHHRDLKPFELDFLAKMAEVDKKLQDAAELATEAGIDWHLLNFSRDFRVVVCYGQQGPLTAEHVSVLVDTQGHRDALREQLRSARQNGEAVIDWSPNSRLLSERRESSLYRDIRAYTAIRKALATDGSHPTIPRVHWLSDSSTPSGRDPGLLRAADGGMGVGGHRGAEHDRPENTWAAFELALAQGASALECDVRMTRDGHLVVIHDAKLDRTANGTGRVEDMTLAQLQALDYGTKHPSAHLGDAQGDTGIVVLEDLLRFVRDYPRPVKLFTEIKDRGAHGAKVAEEVTRLLNKLDMAWPTSAADCRAVVISFWPDSLRRMWEAAPNVPTVLMLDTKESNVKAIMAAAKWAHASAIGPHVLQLRARPDLMARAADAGLGVLSFGGPDVTAQVADMALGLFGFDGRFSQAPVITEGHAAEFCASIGVDAFVTGDPSPVAHLLRPGLDGPASPLLLPGQTEHQADTGLETEAAELDPGERWRTAPAGIDPDGTLAEQALRNWETPLTPKQVERLCRWRGTGEQTVDEVQADARAWATLTGREQRALIDHYPEFIGNGIGFPEAARFEANSVKLALKRTTRDRLLREQMHRNLTPVERRYLRRVAALDKKLAEAAQVAAKAGTEWHLLGLSRDWRVLICYGSTGPLTADRLSLLVNRKGSSSSDALRDQLRQYDCVLDWSPNRQLLRKKAAQMARLGESQLYRETTAYTAARKVWTRDDSHPTVPRVHFVSDSSTPPPRRWPATGRPLADPVLLRDPETGLTVVGHRGALIDRPELTLAGYKLALDQGAGGIECDIQLTSDGHMVVIHDATVDRTANGTGRVEDMTLEELQALDYGTKHPSAHLGEAQGDTGIVLLKDLLELVHGYPRPVQLYVETKRTKYGAQVEQELVRLLHELGMASPTSPEQARVVVVSKWADSLWRVRTAVPNVPTALILGGLKPSREIANRWGATAITVNIQELISHPELVVQAAEAGLGVVCAGRTTSIAEIRGGMGEIGRGATLRRHAEYCQSLGVDAITVNNPGQVVGWLRPGTANHELSRNSAEGVLEEVSTITDGGIDVGLSVDPATGDVPAADLYRALDSKARPTTYAQAQAVLNAWEDGSFAVFTSSLRGDENQGDAWLAVKRGGEIWVYNPFTGTYTKWPAYWDNDMYAHTAVAYFDKEGQPDRRLDGTPGELEAAERVGRIRGPGQEGGPAVAEAPTPEPEDGPTDHAAQPPAPRENISPTTEPAADAATRTGEASGAEGRSGRHIVGVAAFDFDGTIARRDTLIPFLARTFGWPRVIATWVSVAVNTRGRDAIKVELVGRLFKGMPAAKLDALGKSYAATLFELLKPEMVEQVRWHKSQDHAVVMVSASLVAYLGPLAQELGIDDVLGVELEVDDFGLLTGNVVGGENTRGAHKVTRLESWLESHGVDPGIELWAYGDSAGDVELLARSDHPTWVGDRRVAREGRVAGEQGGPAVGRPNFGRTTPGHPDAPHREGRPTDGRRTSEPAEAPPRRGFRRWLHSLGLGNARANCGAVVIKTLSEWMGRPFHLAEAPSRKGLPARAVFEALGLRPDVRMNPRGLYDEVKARLEDPDVPVGSVAVLASRWAGDARRPGHVYLAVKRSDGIYMWDPHTRQLSRWPPHWGQDAVSHTAVGYLKPDGEAVVALDADNPEHVAALAAVGDLRVEGLPDDRRGEADRDDVDVPLRLDAADSDARQPVRAMADAAGMDPDITTTIEPTPLRLSDGHGESSFELRVAQEIQLGGSTDADVVIASPSVSTEHATIGSGREGQLWIRDNGSTNGTWVNGDRLPPNHEYVLRDGDVIRLGDYEMTVRLTHSGPEPVTVRLSRDSDVVPLRLRPGSETALGQIQDSPLATVFGELEGVSHSHASIGVTWDGQAWIRDNGSSHGTWINGHWITPGRKVPLYSADTLKMGDFETTVTTEPHPAELLWYLRLPHMTHIMKMPIQPGVELSLGSDASSALPRMIAEKLGEDVLAALPRIAPNHATLGITPEGRAWIRDNGSPEGTLVDGGRCPPSERVVLRDKVKVTLGEGGPDFTIRTHVSERPPLDLRLVRPNGEAVVQVPARAELKLGSASDSPLGGVVHIAPDHARIAVHPDGYVWIRDAGSGEPTFVNNLLLVDTEQIQLRDGDAIHLGLNYSFTVRFVEPLRLESQPKPVALRMARLEHAEPLRIDPGSDVLLGRAHESPLHELLANHDSVGVNHASIGVHPSGRVWIRDNGSATGTTVNGDRIEADRKTPLHPGQRIRIGTFETTVEFTAPELSDLILVADRNPETMQAVEEMALIPSAVYDRIMEHLEALPSGGVTLGSRPIEDLPGVEDMGPAESWWAGVYHWSHRRILVNTGAASAGGSVVLHEFGHAADHAYCDGIHPLSKTAEWVAVHEEVQRIRRGRGLNKFRGAHRKRVKHYDKPEELFAEGFAAWLEGDEALLALAHGDTRAAVKLRSYYDGVFGPRE